LSNLRRSARQITPYDASSSDEVEADTADDEFIRTEIAQKCGRFQSVSGTLLERMLRRIDDLSFQRVN
jgi:hypothetical protein